jgi:N-acetylmuramoyl-L-alanine amidase
MALNFLKKVCVFIFFAFVQVAIAQVNTQPLAFFVGHSQWNKGARGIQGILEEWDYCDAVAQQAMKLASQYDMNLKVFYRNNIQSYSKAMDDLWQRKNAWSEIAPVIECHYNITPEKLADVQKNASVRQLFVNNTPPKKGTLQGTWVLYQPNQQSKTMAMQLLDNVLSIMPRDDKNSLDVSEVVSVVKGDRGSRLLLSPYAKAPALLLEIGYADNPAEVAMMQADDFKQKLAQAILQTFSITPHSLAETNSSS